MMKKLQKAEKVRYLLTLGLFHACSFSVAVVGEGRTSIGSLFSLLL